MNLPASAVMANYMNKAQLNNFMNSSPSKSQYSASVENPRDFPSKSSSQYTPSAQRYSPELEGLRREINDQMRSYFYSLSSDITALKKDNTESKAQFEDLRREIESTNSKLAQIRQSSASELRETSSKENKLGDSARNSWARSDRKADDAIGSVGEINERIFQISRQIHTLNSEIETLKKPNYVSKEQFSRTMGDVIDELERKLQIINERVRERIEEMDISLVRSQNEKEKDLNRLYGDLKNMQSSILKVNDQFNHTEANVEEQVRKMVLSFSNDFRNLSSTASSAEHKHKTHKNEPSILASAYPNQNKEVEVKLRELDSISQTIGLLEKEMRAKIDMVDLNINSIKRNLELELSIQLKQMVLPIQKNLDQYLQSTESRFSALEDAVLNHMKRDSYIMTAERASRLRGSGSLDLRGSNFEENMQFANKQGFNNISIIEPHAEFKGDKRGSQPENRMGSGLKERGREKDRYGETFKIDEVDSVLSMNEALQSKQEGRYSRQDDQKRSHSPYQNEDKHNSSQDEEEVQEPPATNTAKQVLPDKDRNKKQKSCAGLFKDLEEKNEPEAMFRDFPSTCAMKSALEMEHPDNKVQDRGSAKKKKPEIDVSDTHKSSLRDAPKKQGNQASPFNMGSKLALAANSYINEEEEEQAPPLRKNAKDTKEKDTGSKGREAPVNLLDEVEDDFQGNIKGLLRKSRNKKENQFQEEEEKPANKLKGSQKMQEEAPPQRYGKEPVPDPFKKNAPLPKKSFEKQNEQVQKQLPPVDTKSMKNFNKSTGNNPGPLKQPQGKGYNQPQNMGYQRGAYDEAWGMQGDEEEGESVEEIVYNVDEEGFLVDEQGNYLVDEQGNFLQLSPEQMREIEEKDLVYEKEY